MTQEPAAPDTADAYLDEAARVLVRQARERRRLVDRSIESYETTATERSAVGLRALRRDRLLWQREVASRIEWERDGPIRIEVLGARETLPAFMTHAQVPAELEGWMPHLAFDPADPYLLTGWGDGGDDVPHPLAPGSEVDYRFRSGDTTRIRLPDDREVRLLELEVLPRRTAGNLVRGSFWIDEESHAVVRLTVRLADEFDPDRDYGDPEDQGSDVAVEVEYVTIEYGLWDFRWWLPRLFAVRGAADLAGIADLPFRYERTYAGYDVRGDPGDAAPLALEESPYAPGERVRCPTRGAITVRMSFPGGSAEGEAPGDEEVVGDTAVVEAEPERVEPEEGGADGEETSEAERAACARFRVTVPEDSAGLLTSPALPAASPFAFEDGLLTEAELASVGEQLRELAPEPWQISDPELEGVLRHARYNRVEGLSPGTRASLDLGPVEARATARLGLADLRPRGELAFARDGPGPRIRLAGYRRLTAMDRRSRPHAATGSLASLLFGRDDVDFYRTLGVELAGEPAPSRRRWYAWRIFAQRERPAAKETDFSLPHLVNDRNRFPGVDPARDATQYGAEVLLRGSWGDDPLGFRLDTELGLEAAGGTFDYVLPSVGARIGFPLPGSLVGLAEAEAGTAGGSAPRQHLWSVGGPFSVRGYESAAMVGESFLRGSVEVGTRLPAVRLRVFSDAGWAGSFDGRGAEWLFSAGAGLSVLDGLLRLDVSRALRAPTDWRVSLQLDGWL